MIKMQNFCDEELQNFRRYQRLSYQILEDTALGLRVGDSEESTSKRTNEGFASDLERCSIAETFLKINY